MAKRMTLAEKLEKSRRAEQDAIRVEITTTERKLERIREALPKAQEAEAKAAARVALLESDLADCMAAIGELEALLNEATTDATATPSE